MENNSQGQGGSGSAENKGQSRQDQLSKAMSIGSDERQDIADQTGLKPEDIADLQDVGGMSGRGDAAGGSGDNMENTSTNEGTDKF
jgi:hypothetical protein